MKYAIGILIALGVCLATAQSYDVSIGNKSNYNSWGTGWDSVTVMENNLVKLAIVPIIGGRIMKFDLVNAVEPTLYIDTTNKGKTPATSVVLGGYRTLASPQVFSASITWPPSPILDVKPYSCTVTSNTVDSAVVFLQSGVETTSTYTALKGLQFKRTIALYKASSHASVQVTMVNKGTQTLSSHGIWDITECPGSNNGKTDTVNLWVYFPLNPQSTMGKGRGYAQLQNTDTTQWKRNIAPGIMGVQYKKKSGKIGADCTGGWVCYVNRLTGYAFVKRFTYEQGKTYPDSGSSVEIYTDPSSPYLENEVMGPMTALAPNDSIRFVEDWFAARSFGPVLAVNNAGLITHRLSASQSRDTITAKGTYGVFYPGFVKEVFKSSNGTTLSTADSVAVSPLDSFVLKDTLKVPTGAAFLHLALYTASGVFAGYLDSVTVTSTGVLHSSGRETNLSSLKNVLIVNSGTGVSMYVPFTRHYTIELLRLNGTRITTFQGVHPQNFVIPRTLFSHGVCVMRMSSDGFKETRTLVVP